MKSTFTGKETANIKFWGPLDSNGGTTNILSGNYFANNFAGTGHAAIEINLPCTEENENLINEQQERINFYHNKFGIVLRSGKLFKKIKMNKNERELHRRNIINNHISSITKKLTLKQKESFNKYLSNEMPVDEQEKYENNNLEAKKLKCYLDGELPKEDMELYEKNNLPGINTDSFFQVYFSFYGYHAQPFYLLSSHINHDNSKGRYARHINFTELGKMLFGDYEYNRGHKKSTFTYSPIGSIHGSKFLENSELIQSRLKIAVLEERESSCEHLRDYINSLMNKTQQLSANCISLIDSYIPYLKSEIIKATTIEDNIARKKVLKPIFDEILNDITITRKKINDLNEPFRHLSYTEIKHIEENFIQKFGTPEAELDLPLGKNQFDYKHMIKKMVDEITDYEAFELNFKNCSTTTSSIVLSGLKDHKDYSHIENTFKNNAHVFATIINPTSVYDGTRKVLDIINGKSPANIINRILETTYIHRLAKYFRLDCAIRLHPPFREMDQVSSLTVPTKVKKYKTINLEGMFRAATNKFDFIQICLYDLDEYKELDYKVIKYVNNKKTNKQYDSRIPDFILKKSDKQSAFVEYCEIEMLEQNKEISKEKISNLCNLIWKLSLVDINFITATSKDNIISQISQSNISVNDKQLLKDLFEDNKKETINSFIRLKSNYLKAWKLREESIEILKFFNDSVRIFPGIKLRRRIMLGFILLPHMIARRLINPLKFYNEIDAFANYGISVPHVGFLSTLIKYTSILILKPISFAVAPFAGLQYLINNLVKSIDYMFFKKTKAYNTRVYSKSKREERESKVFSENKLEITGKDPSRIISNICSNLEDKSKNKFILVLSKDAEDSLRDAIKSNKHIKISPKFNNIRDKVIRAALKNKLINNRIDLHIEEINNKQNSDFISNYINLTKTYSGPQFALQEVNKIYNMKSSKPLRKKLQPIYDVLNRKSPYPTQEEITKCINDARSSIFDKHNESYKALTNLYGFLVTKDKIFDKISSKILFKKLVRKPEPFKFNYNSIKKRLLDYLAGKKGKIVDNQKVSLQESVDFIKKSINVIDTTDNNFILSLKNNLLDITKKYSNYSKAYKSYINCSKDTSSKKLSAISEFSNILEHNGIIKKGIFDKVIPNTFSKYYEVLSNELVVRNNKIMKKIDSEHKMKEAKRLFKSMIFKLKQKNYNPRITPGELVNELSLDACKLLIINDKKLINSILNYLKPRVNEKIFNNIKSNPSIHSIFSELYKHTCRRNNESLKQMEEFTFDYIKNLMNYSSSYTTSNHHKDVYNIASKSSMIISKETAKEFKKLLRYRKIKFPSDFKFKTVISILDNESKSRKNKETNVNKFINSYLDKFDSNDKYFTPNLESGIKYLQLEEKPLIISDTNLIDKLNKSLSKFEYKSVITNKKIELSSDALDYLKAVNNTRRTASILKKHILSISFNKKIFFSKDELTLLKLYSSITDEVPNNIKKDMKQLCLKVNIKPLKKYSFEGVIKLLDTIKNKHSTTKTNDNLVPKENRSNVSSITNKSI